LALRTALVADDEPLHRDLLCVFLETMGFGVVVMASEATRVVPLFLTTEPRPSIVLLDHPIGRFSGLEVLRDLLATDAHARVVVMSQDEDARTYCMQSGAFDFIVKPYALPDVGRAVNRAMRPAVGS
jgi:DNA-binding NtrC family response regulator